MVGSLVVVIMEGVEATEVRCLYLIRVLNGLYSVVLGGGYGGGGY